MTFTTWYGLLQLLCSTGENPAKKFFRFTFHLLLVCSRPCGLRTMQCFTCGQNVDCLMLPSATQSCESVQADWSAADVTKESFFTVAIASVSAGSRVARIVVDGSQAVTCTRCLRHPNAGGSLEVRETFLLELPHGVASALANDVNAELRRRRTRSGSAARLKLHNALTVVIRVHDQKAQRVNGGQDGLRATGEFVLESDVLRDAALKSLEHSLAHDIVADDLQADIALHAVAQTDSDSCETGERISLRMQLQRVSSWVDDAPDAVELSQSKSQRGNRSLRMGGTDMRWQPIVQDGMKQASTGSDALSGSMMGLDVMSGLVLEESFAGGVRRETIRSSVRILNSLDFPIEARPLPFLCQWCLSHLPHLSVHGRVTMLR